MERYGVPTNWRRHRAFQARFWLIYGRSEENPKEIAKLRAYYGLKSLQILTYDNLRGPDQWCKDYLTVHSQGDVTYKAMRMPPTAKWTASSPESWVAVTGRQQVVLASDLPEDRKKSLVEQIPEWDAWADYWLQHEYRES